MSDQIRKIKNESAGVARVPFFKIRCLKTNLKFTIAMPGAYPDTTMVTTTTAPVTTMPATTTTTTVPATTIATTTTTTTIAPAAPPYPILDLDLQSARPLLLTYVNRDVTPLDQKQLPRITSFLNGDCVNADHAMEKMTSYLNAQLWVDKNNQTLPRNAMVQMLNEKRKRRISDESMQAINSMNLLHLGFNPNNIGLHYSPNKCQRRFASPASSELPAFCAVAQAAAPLY